MAFGNHRDRMEGLLCALVLGGLLFTTVSAQAQTEAEAETPNETGASARDLFVQGSSSYRVGNYEAAIESWQRAFELDPRPLLLYNLGQAYERLGRLVEAVDSTERYLREASPTDSHRADATARLASMRERLQRTGVLIQCELEGATILVDGEDAGRTPRRDPIRLAPGTHRIEIRFEGYHPYRTSVSVTGGMVADVVAELDPLPGTLATDVEMETVRPVAAYYLIGAGGGAAVAGALLGWAGSNKADDATYSNDSDASTARAMAITGDILLFGGLAAAAGGVVWLFMGSEEREVGAETATSWRLTPVVGPNVVGADAQVRF